MSNIYKNLFYISFVGLAGLIYYVLYLMNVFSPLYEGTVVLLAFVIITFLLLCIEMIATPIEKNKEEDKDGKEL